MRFNHRQLRDAKTKVQQAERAGRRRAARWSALFGLVAGASTTHVYAYQRPDLVARFGAFTQDDVVRPLLAGLGVFFNFPPG